MKKKTLNYIKFAVLLWTTLIGFFTTYSFLWVSIGLPIDWRASLIIVAISALSEWGYVSWLTN